MVLQEQLNQLLKEQQQVQRQIEGYTLEDLKEVAMVKKAFSGISDYNKKMLSLENTLAKGGALSTEQVFNTINEMRAMHFKGAQGEIKRPPVGTVPKPEEAKSDEQTQEISKPTTPSTEAEQRDKQNKETVKLMTNFQAENLNRLNEIKEELVKLNRTSTKTLQSQQ